MKQNGLIIIGTAAVMALCGAIAVAQPERVGNKPDPKANRNLEKVAKAHNLPALKNVWKTTSGTIEAKRPSTKQPVRTIRRADGSVITLGGALHYSKAWTDEYPPYGLYSFTTAPDGGNNVEMIGNYYFFQTGNGAIYDDAIHVVDYSEYDGILFVNYNKVDLNTGDYVDYASFNDLSMYPYDCDYDPMTGGVVGCFQSADGQKIELAYVDYDNRTRQAICELPDVLACVAVNGDGEIFGIDKSGVIRQYDRTNGASTQVLETGLTPNYMQSATFDRETGLMYWAYTDGNISSLYEIDVKAPSIGKIYDFANAEEFTALYVQVVKDPGAPSEPTDFTLDFGAENTGTVSFTLPSQARDGSALTDILDYELFANGVSTLTGQGAPGEAVSKQVTVPYGDTNFLLKVRNGAGESNPVKALKWIGLGKTFAPGNVAQNVNGNQISLTWEAPYGAINDGYIDFPNLTYTVTRYPEGKVVAEGLHECSFSDTFDPEVPTVIWYGIAAKNGEYLSDEAQSAKFPVGDAFPTPYYEDFENPDNFNLFTVLDNNNDGRSWMLGLHQGWNPTGFAFCNSNKYGLTNEFSDDWFISPKIILAPESIYEFSFCAWNMNMIEEILSVYLGKGEDPTVASDYQEVIAPFKFNEAYEARKYYNYVFVPETSDKYRFAFYCTSAFASAAQIDEVLVEEVGKVAGPAAPADFTATPFAEGAKGINLSFKVPVKNYKGTSEVTVTKVELLRDKEVIKTFDAPAKGEVLSYADTECNDGVNKYRVRAYTAEGMGMYAEASAFSGIDEPALPANLAARDLGDKIEISWENPGATGANGGYVAADQMKYVVYDVYGTNATPLTDYITDTKHTIYNANDGSQVLAYYGVSAFAGDKSSPVLVTDPVIIGAPHKLPFVETFYNAIFDNEGWWQVGDIESRFYTYGYDSSDEGSTAMMWSPIMWHTDTWLNSGKISIEGASNPQLMFDWKADPEMNGSLDFYIVSGGAPQELVYSVDLTANSAEKEWRTQTVDLAKFKDSKSIIIKICATSHDYGKEVWLDRIQVRNVLDKDAITYIAAAKYFTCGKANPVTVTVENNGKEMLPAGCKVNLYMNGELIDTKEAPAVASLEKADVVFEVTPSVVSNSDLNFYAETIYEADEDQTNNKSQTVTVGVNYPEVETPYGLKADDTENEQLTLTWTAPSTEAMETTEGFDFYDNGDLTFGNWMTYDFDQGLACGINGCNLPHVQEPWGWMVFNPGESGITLDTRPQFNALSGEQYAIAMVGYYSGKPNSDDWLISPELSGSSQTILFWGMKDAEYYNEVVEVYYSDTDNKVESFKLIKEINIDSAMTWKEYSFDVPEGAKYFAIRYMAANQFFIGIDDITYICAAQNLLGFNVYRDKEKVGETAPDVTTFTLPNDLSAGHEYFVTAVYEVGESAPSNRLRISGVNGIYSELDGKCKAGKGYIRFASVSGDNVEIIATNGISVYRNAAADESFEVELAAGAYIVKIGSKVSKVIVK